MKAKEKLIRAMLDPRNWLDSTGAIGVYRSPRSHRMAINENVLAKKIAEAEGLKKVLSIADCKECLRITLDLLACERPSEVLALLEKHQGRML